MGEQAMIICDCPSSLKRIERIVLLLQQGVAGHGGE